jgi:hypothetical protein
VIRASVRPELPILEIVFHQDEHTPQILRERVPEMSIEEIGVVAHEGEDFESATAREDVLEICGDWGDAEGDMSETGKLLKTCGWKIRVDVEVG